MKIIKKYSCKTVISFGARLSKGVKRLNFEAKTNGGSTYSTDEEDVQNAIENHPYYKQGVIKLESIRKIIKKDEDDVSTLQQTVPVETVVVETPAENKTNKPKKEVRVSGQDDAVEYLINEFGVSRTAFKKTDAIKKYAEANGIVFVGI